MKNDAALNTVRFIAPRWKTRNFFNVPTDRKGAVSGAAMRHKQHILFLPKIDVFDPLVRIIVRLRVNNVPVCSVRWPSHNNTAVNGGPRVTLQAETLMVPLRRLLYFLNGLLWSGTASSPFFKGKWQRYSSPDFMLNSIYSTFYTYTTCSARSGL